MSATVHHLFEAKRDAITRQAINSAYEKALRQLAERFKQISSPINSPHLLQAAEVVLLLRNLGKCASLDLVTSSTSSWTHITVAAMTERELIESPALDGWTHRWTHEGYRSSVLVLERDNVRIQVVCMHPEQAV